MGRILDLRRGEGMLGEFMNLEDVENTIRQEGSDRRDHSINNIPWPLQNDIIEKVLIEGMLERVDDIEKVMRELHRVCKDGTKISIIVPWYLSSNSTKPGNKNKFSISTFYYFVRGKDPTYKGPYFEILDIKFKHQDKIEKMFEKWWFKWMVGKGEKIVRKIEVNKFVTFRAFLGFLFGEVNQW